MIDATFTHTHASGLWDTNKDRWAVFVAQALKGSDVVTLTEWTTRPLPASWFKDRGFTLVTWEGPGRTEVAIAVNDDTFKVADDWCIPISVTSYALGSGKVRPRVHLGGVELKHFKSDRLVNVEVFHSPSAIEGHGGLLKGVRRVRANLECYSAISAHRKAELRHEPSIVAADWNLDHLKLWVRTLLKTRVRGYRSAWKRPLPKGGNMRFGRLIDGVRVTRQVAVLGKGTRVMGRVIPFDHRMVRTNLGLRKPQR